ncbi:hypothetical protein [Corynebacterium afermentans]|uniref:hypothetical protein n=1 Tax=Corynebacterium afermentans TaxID=38286 RepID=UPI002572E141|nr:hypothetical protein [Corynebacterium afermentans]MDC7109513.1 hypothetical protein [Corynebacterium afermentans]
MIAAEQTMADRANPRFEDPANFKLYDGYEFGPLKLNGVDYPAQIDRVRFFDERGELKTSGRAQGMSLSLGVSSYDFWPPKNGFEGNTVTTKPIKFLVSYTDGSVDIFEQSFKFTMDDSWAATPSLDDPSFTFEQEDVREITGIPPKSRISVINVPDGWKAEIVEKQLIEITAPSEADANNRGWSGGYSSSPITVSIRFPDGSSGEYTLDVFAVPPVDEPDVAPTREPDVAPWEPETIYPEEPVVVTVTETIQVPTTVKTAVTNVATTTATPPTVTVTEKPKPAVTTTVTNVATTTATPPTVTVTGKPNSPVTATITETLAPTKTVTVTQSLKQENNGSSTGSIIALVIGLLSLIGGVGAALVGNPQLRAALPF